MGYMEHLYIIAETDSCDKLDPSVCLFCPLAKQKLKADGSYASCADAVNFRYEGDGSYAKAAATEILHQIIKGEEDESGK
jgi:hypothetical protein